MRLWADFYRIFYRNSRDRFAARCSAGLPPLSRTAGTRLDTPDKVVAYLEQINAPATPPPGNVSADEFDPERILRVFADHGVDCLILGGFGAQAHGAHRQTLDIAVVPRSTDSNLERLASALRDLGARLRVGGLTDDEARALPVTIDTATLRSFVSSTWMTDAGPLDVLGDLPVAGGASRPPPRRAPG